MNTVTIEDYEYYKKLDEAIEFLKKQNYMYTGSLLSVEVDAYVTKLNEAIHSIEEALQRGEKYRQIWVELTKDANDDDDQGLLFKLDFIEQKYFPEKNKKHEADSLVLDTEGCGNYIPGEEE